MATPLRRSARRHDGSGQAHGVHVRLDAVAVVRAAKFQWPIPDKGLSKRIHRISAPTLIIWGEKDGLVPPIYAEEFHARIAGSRVVIMKQAAHMTMLEQPEEFASLISGFLSA